MQILCMDFFISLSLSFSAHRRRKKHTNFYWKSIIFILSTHPTILLIEMSDIINSNTTKLWLSFFFDYFCSVLVIVTAWEVDEIGFSHKEFKPPLIRIFNKRKKVMKKKISALQIGFDIGRTFWLDLKNKEINQNEWFDIHEPSFYYLLKWQSHNLTENRISKYIII